MNSKAVQLANVEMSKPKFTTKAGIVSTSGVILFGIGVVSGGSFNYWNGGLKAGYYDFLAISLFTICGFICLVLCLAEMTSTLPFSGGLYGFVRACLGPFMGYMIGIIEVMQNILNMSFLTLSLGRIFSNLIDSSVNISNIFSVGILFIAIMGNIVTGNSYWYSQYSLCILVLFIMLAYIVISGMTSNIADEVIEAQHTIFENSSDTQQFYTFMKALPYASFFFTGIEMIPLCGNDTISPKQSIPKGMIISILIISILVICIITTTSGQEQSIVSIAHTEEFPLSFAWCNLFEIEKYYSNLFSIPPIFLSLYSYVYISSRQLVSMSDSGLLPECFHSMITNTDETTPANTTGVSIPPYALLFIFITTIGLVVLANFGEAHDMARDIDDTINIDALETPHEKNSILLILFSINCLCCYTMYIAVCWAFLIFRRRYSSLENIFFNPLHQYSAYIGMFVFFIGWVAIVGFYRYGFVMGLAMLSLFICITLNYAFVVRNKQRFSEHEKRILFVAYVINANRKRKQSKYHKRRGSGNNWGNIITQFRKDNSSAYSVSNKDGVSISSSNQAVDENGSLYSAHSKSTSRKYSSIRRSYNLLFTSTDSDGSLQPSNAVVGGLKPQGSTMSTNSNSSTNNNSSKYSATSGGSCLSPKGNSPWWGSWWKSTTILVPVRPSSSHHPNHNTTSNHMNNLSTNNNHNHSHSQHHNILNTKSYILSSSTTSLFVQATTNNEEEQQQQRDSPRMNKQSYSPRYLHSHQSGNNHHRIHPIASADDTVDMEHYGSMSMDSRMNPGHARGGLIVDQDQQDQSMHRMETAKDNDNDDDEEERGRDRRERLQRATTRTLEQAFEEFNPSLIVENEIPFQGLSRQLSRMIPTSLHLPGSNKEQHPLNKERNSFSQPTIHHHHHHSHSQHSSFSNAKENRSSFSSPAATPATTAAAPAAAAVENQGHSQRSSFSTIPEYRNSFSNGIGRAPYSLTSTATAAVNVSFSPLPTTDTSTGFLPLQSYSYDENEEDENEREHENAQKIVNIDDTTGRRLNHNHHHAILQSSDSMIIHHEDDEEHNNSSGSSGSGQEDAAAIVPEASDIEMNMGTDFSLPALVINNNNTNSKSPTLKGSPVKGLLLESTSMGVSTRRLESITEDGALIDEGDDSSKKSNGPHRVRAKRRFSIVDTLGNMFGNTIGGGIDGSQKEVSSPPSSTNSTLRKSYNAAGGGGIEQSSSKSHSNKNDPDQPQEDVPRLTNSFLSRHQRRFLRNGTYNSSISSFASTRASFVTFNARASTTGSQLSNKISEGLKVLSTLSFLDDPCFNEYAANIASELINDPEARHHEDDDMHYKIQKTLQKIQNNEEHDENDEVDEAAIIESLSKKFRRGELKK